MSIAQRPLVTRSDRAGVGTKKVTPTPRATHLQSGLAGEPQASSRRRMGLQVPLLNSAREELALWHDDNHPGPFSDCTEQPCAEVSRRGAGATVPAVSAWHYSQGHPHSDGFCGMEPCHSVWVAARRTHGNSD